MELKPKRGTKIMRKLTLLVVLVAFVLGTLAPSVEAAAAKKAPTKSVSKAAPKKASAKKVKKKKKPKKRRVRRSGTHWIRSGITIRRR